MVKLTHVYTIECSSFILYAYMNFIDYLYHLIAKQGFIVSISIHSIPLEKIHNLSLEKCIAPSNDKTNKHAFLRLNNQELLLESDNINASIAAFKSQQNTVKVIPEQENTLELVVFGQTRIKQLADLADQSQILIEGLNTINNRNNLLSYRFQVSCENLEHSRQLLAKFSLQHQIEAALLKDTPSLARPGLLVMDMDSTTIEIECIDEIAKLAGVGQQVAEVTELAMEGKLDFTQSLFQRVAQLKDAPETILAEVAENIPLMPGLETLVNTLKAHQWRVAIASGGFTYFADHLGQLLKLDATYANQLEIIDGKLTGKVVGDVIDANAKALTLNELSKKYNIDKKQTVAMGDGANDLIMMNAAALGVAFHAKALVLAQADSCINHSGLDCLLHWLN